MRLKHSSPRHLAVVHPPHHKALAFVVSAQHHYTQSHRSCRNHLDFYKSPCTTIPALAFARASIVRTPPDLEAYISRYGGYTKLRRLEWIAQRCPALAPDCYRSALALLRQGINTQSYREISARAVQLMGPEYAEDTEWAEQVGLFVCGSGLPVSFLACLVFVWICRPVGSPTFEQISRPIRTCYVVPSAFVDRTFWSRALGIGGLCGWSRISLPATALCVYAVMKLQHE